MTDVTPTEESAPSPTGSESTSEPAGATPTEETSSESTAPSTESPSPSDEQSAPEADPDAGVVPRQVVGIDSSVEQGNRVTVTTPNLTTDPIGDLKARIIDHFGNASHVVADLRALADEVETLLNTVRAGI